MVKDPETSPNPALRFFDVLRRQPPRFRKYLFAVGLFGVGDFSHSLLILAATQILTPTYGVVRAAQLAGALYVARNIVQVLVSYPAGYLADRFGATSVLAWGYAIGAATGAATAMAFALPSGRMPALVLVFVLGGIYVAVQEALEPTVTAEVLSAETLTTGFGALGAVNGCAKLVASSFTGFVWSAISPQVAMFPDSSTIRFDFPARGDGAQPLTEHLQARRDPKAPTVGRDGRPLRGGQGGMVWIGTKGSYHAGRMPCGRQSQARQIKLNTLHICILQVAGYSHLPSLNRPSCYSPTRRVRHAIPHPYSNRDPPDPVLRPEHLRRR